MTKFKTLLASLSLLALAATQVAGQLGVGYAEPSEGQIDFFSGKGKAATTNASYFVTGARQRGAARVEYINVTSDAHNGKLKFYQADNSITVTNALAAGLTNILLSGHIGVLVAGDLVAIESVTLNKFQVAAVSLTNASGIHLTNTFSGTLTAVAPTDFALAVGDRVWKLTEAGVIHLGVSTNNYPVAGSSSTLYTFAEGRPGVVLAHQTTGGSTNVTSINLISGRYYKPE